MNICLVSANGVMELFGFPGNINFAADDQGSFSCIMHERLLCLFIVCETIFTIGESLTVSHANDTQAQQVAQTPRTGRVSTETLREWECQLQIQREQWGRRGQQETVEQRVHRIAQWRQCRQLETEEQRNSRLESEALWSFYTVENPHLLVCRCLCRYKFQPCTTAQRIIIFMRTALLHLCFVFVFVFLNPVAEVILNMLFNTLLTITPHNTQKRRRRKQRTTYGPSRRYSC